MKEPRIAVCLIEAAKQISVTLPSGTRVFGPADIGTSIHLEPGERFCISATIGIDFHWEQQEEQQFGGDIKIIEHSEGYISLINLVMLEDYLQSVICSEMKATMPGELVAAHTIISRSWLLAQLEARASRPIEPPGLLPGGREYRGWTDRQAHAGFDVCADDHCQRYQGLGKILEPSIVAAVAATRGVVLSHSGQICDARFSKCCGGVTEDFTRAWGDDPVPYLVPVFDGEACLPQPPLSQELAAHEFIHDAPSCWCGNPDPTLLDRVLNDYDQATTDFFRWQRQLDPTRIGEWVQQKLGIDIGPVSALEVVERGLSGRIFRLLLRGERAELIVGKELAIRRVLADSHLLSSAFVAQRTPDGFVLTGAGWGHGVGLCQIGAAVMAATGYDHESILAHYYPGTTLRRLYPS